MKKKSPNSDQLGFFGYLCLSSLSVVGSTLVASATGGASVSGSFLAGLLPKMIDLSGGIFSNMTAHHLESLQYRHFQRFFIEKAEDLPNHDLLKAFRDAAIKTLEQLSLNYEQQYKQEHPELTDYHYSGIRNKIKKLQEEVKGAVFSKLVDHFEGKDLDMEMKAFAEGKSLILQEMALGLLDTEGLKYHGDYFQAYFREHFSKILQFYFGEELKSQPKAWVAFQRVWLKDLDAHIQQLNRSAFTEREKEQLLVTAHEIGQLSSQFEALDSSLELRQMRQLEQLSEWVSGQDKQLQRYYSDFRKVLDDQQSELRADLTLLVQYEHEITRRLFRDELEDATQQIIGQLQGKVVSEPSPSFPPAFETIQHRVARALQEKFRDVNGHFFKKYIDSVYAKREQAQEAFGRFINQQEKLCYIITGKAGKGKTTLLCNLALSLSKGNVQGKLPFLLNSPDLRLKDVSLKQETGLLFEGLSWKATAGLLQENNTKLLIFIDAVNELEGVQIFEEFNSQLDDWVQEIRTHQYPIQFCISCRSDFWHLFNRSNWALNETFSPEEGLSQHPTCEIGNFEEEAIDKILEKYFWWFGLEGKIIGRARQQCRDPLMLRYLCEAYTSRKSNDKATPPEKLPRRDIGTIEILQRKKVFDTFVSNIRERMFERVQVTLNQRLREEKLVDYTTIYLINLSRVMLENRRSYITLEEARQVATELGHPDAELRPFEFFTEKSIFYMFLDEGLILDKYQRQTFYFIFESYFEYSLGRYIALQRWAGLLKEEQPIHRIKKDLEELLNEHSDVIENQNFTNILGAIQYAILVTEDHALFQDYPNLYIELISRMLNHDNSTLVQQQKAFSTLRASGLVTGLSTIKEPHRIDHLIQKILGELFYFASQAEDFVIQWDLESTLVNLGELRPEIVITEMEEWAEEEGNKVLQLFASQVIARLAKIDLDTTIQVIQNLARRPDYQASFWLGRTLVFAICEMTLDREIAVQPKNHKKLWDILIGMIESTRTSPYTKDLAFSFLPFLAKDHLRNVQKILDLFESEAISIWGGWNMVYELRVWPEYGFLNELSWVWDLLERIVEENNPHLNYAVLTTLEAWGADLLGSKGKQLLQLVQKNQWTPGRIVQKPGRPISRKKTDKTGIVYSPVYLEPSYDNHTECRQRLQAIIGKLIDIGEDHYNWVQPLVAGLDQLQKVHFGKNDRHRNGSEWPNYIKEVIYASKQLTERKIKKRQDVGPAELRYESFDIAQISAGGVISAVDYVMEYSANSAWSLGRPPGHLANNSICILNNIAIGANYAREEYDLERILIIDCDAHHGKHTAWVFREDPNVVYFSIHIEGGYAKEEGYPRHTGDGPGTGYTFNLIYPPYTDNRGYLYIVSRLLKPLALEFKPDLIMVSAGFDGHFEDELNPGGMFTEEIYRHLGATIREVADRHDIKVVGAFEGGYGLNSLSNSFVHLMNEVGNWGIPPEQIGYVEPVPDRPDDEKLKQVIQGVEERIEAMKQLKMKDPNYKLFNDAEIWKPRF